MKYATNACAEVIRMNEDRLTATQRITEWFNNPETPEDAWKTWSLHDIAADADVSVHTVSIKLPILVIEKYPEIETHKRFLFAREAWRRHNKRARTTGLTKDDIDDIRERRRNGDTLIQITMDTSYSYSTVRKYCKGIKISRKDLPK